MKPKETPGEFHRRLYNDHSTPGQFTIYKIDDVCSITPLPHNRRDFYKISLAIKSEGILSYADKTFHIKDNALCFFNPMIPYSWEPLSQRDQVYSCLFTEVFLDQGLRKGSLSASPLFKASGHHVLAPDQQSMRFLKSIFEQMLSEIQSSYENKYDLLRSYVQIIMHEALKIEPAGKDQPSAKSSARISSLFLELLERQFPVVLPQQGIQFKNANEFAGQLSVHTNHLNRSLKEITGRTTTEHIAERISKEARALLQHSSWNIAEIARSLGFEHASNFTIFFKKHTGQTPNQFRRQPVAKS